MWLRAARGQHEDAFKKGPQHDAFRQSTLLALTHSAFANLFVFERECPKNERLRSALADEVMVTHETSKRSFSSGRVLHCGPDERFELFDRHGRSITMALELIAAAFERN